MSRGKKFDENEAFIAAWQEDECLWNVNIQLYKDRNARKEGIKKLAQCTGMSGKYTSYFFSRHFLSLPFRYIYTNNSL